MRPDSGRGSVLLTPLVILSLAATLLVASQQPLLVVGVAVGLLFRRPVSLARGIARELTTGSNSAFTHTRPETIARARTETE